MVVWGYVYIHIGNQRWCGAMYTFTSGIRGGVWGYVYIHIGNQWCGTMYTFTSEINGAVGLCIYWHRESVLVWGYAYIHIGNQWGCGAMHAFTEIISGGVGLGKSPKPVRSSQVRVPISMILTSCQSHWVPLGRKNLISRKCWYPRTVALCPIGPI